jgi:DNA-binding HxlR family transcriptional regulator
MSASSVGPGTGRKIFEDFQRTLDVSRSLLSERLGRLVDAGILR